MKVHRCTQLLESAEGGEGDDVAEQGDEDPRDQQRFEGAPTRHCRREVSE